MNKNATFVKQNNSRSEKSPNSNQGSCIPSSSVRRFFAGRENKKIYWYKTYRNREDKKEYIVILKTRNIGWSSLKKMLDELFDGNK